MPILFFMLSFGNMSKLLFKKNARKIGRPMMIVAKNINAKMEEVTSKVLLKESDLTFKEMASVNTR